MFILVVILSVIYQATLGPCKEALNWVDFIYRAEPLSFLCCIWRRNKLTFPFCTNLSCFLSLSFQSFLRKIQSRRHIWVVCLDQIALVITKKINICRVILVVWDIAGWIWWSVWLWVLLASIKLQWDPARKPWIGWISFIGRSPCRFLLYLKKKQDNMSYVLYQSFLFSVVSFLKFLMKKRIREIYLRCHFGSNSFNDY